MTQSMHQVLVVEDERDIRNILRALLEADHYRFIEAETAARGEIEARSHKPDLILVDLGLPDGNGVDLIRRIRAWSSVPIIVLSARTMEEQKIAALDAGADDYVTKPFSTRELLADQAPLLRLGEVQIDLTKRESHGPQGELHLTPLEYRVLESLARHTGLIVRQAQLIRQVWGPERQGDTGSLRVCMKNLRAKVEPDPRRPRYLVTEAGLGYRLRAD
jgi:two-component system, OmpR family, KDP operon response regulator KdpE